MTIDELGDIINADLEVRRYANQNNRWMAHFEHTETKDNEHDIFLTGTHGNGNSPENAILNYIEKIKGKFLVIDAMKKSRREFGVPNTLVRSEQNLKKLLIDLKETE